MNARRMGIATSLAVAFVLGGCAAPDRNFAPPAAHEPKPELTRPADIVAALRRGGYLIYTRHGETNRAELELEAANRESGRFSITDCTTQRNLSPAGIAQARAAGAQFRRIGLPVARYLSSRYCRAEQTARLYADRIEPSEPLTSEGPITKSPVRIAQVRAVLTEAPPTGANTMLFAHQGIFFAATGLTVQEGWSVVLVPGNFTRIVARIAPGDWAALAAAAAPATRP